MTTIADARALADRLDTPGPQFVPAAQAAQVIRELCAMVEAQDWRPIKTAPRDGSHVMVWLDDLDPTINPEIAQWSAAVNDWVTAWDNTIIGPKSAFGLPTHWRPLPSPPTDTGEERT